MMDFDELDILQEVLEPALLEIIKGARAPQGMADRCRERGLVTCEDFFEAIDTSRLDPECAEWWWDAEDMYEGILQFARELDPPAKKQLEILRVRDIWQCCRDKVLKEREQREAESRLHAEEAEARRAFEAERQRQRAREAARCADARRSEAERVAREAREAERREKEAVCQKQLEIKLKAAAIPSLRGLVVPGSRKRARCGKSVGSSLTSGEQDGGGPPLAAADELRARLCEIADVLSQRYRRTQGEGVAHVLNGQVGRLSSCNLTVGYSSTWGLEVREEPSGHRAVRLAREEVLVGGLVEVCPLLRVPVEAGSLDHDLRFGPLGRSALWPPSTGSEVRVPLGYGCLYRQSTQGWNIAPSLARDGDELEWIAVERLRVGDELVAPSGWQELATGRRLGEDHPLGSCVEGGAVGSTRHGPSLVHRFGVFSTCTVEAGEVLDVCPALHLSQAEARLLENYAMQFKLGRSEPTVVLALGIGAVYNHRKWPQVDWLYDCETDAVVFFARQRIEPGEELFIDYGQVYFSSRGVTPACCLADVVWRD